MRIHLFRGKHPIYEALARVPPDGVEYVPKTKESGREEYALYDSFSSQTRAIVDGTLKRLNIPRIIPVFRRYDLVHSCRGFVVLGMNRYVVDFEHVSSFVGMQHSRLQSSTMRNRMDKMLCSPRCMRLLPHSRAAQNSLSALSSKAELERKSTVVYPTVIAPESVPSRANEKTPPRILFYGEYYWKGGRELLRACEQLSKRLDFSLCYISCRVHPPKEVVERAQEAINLEYHEGPIPRAKLFDEVYPSSDLFVMPTYLDTLGFGFLEAMSNGLPCIGTKQFAVPEVVEDGVTGLLIDPPVKFFDDSGIGHPEIDIENANAEKTVDELKAAIERLLTSTNLRSSMGAAARKTMTEGRLSIVARNRILKKVYEESIRH